MSRRFLLPVKRKNSMISLEAFESKISGNGEEEMKIIKRSYMKEYFLKMLVVITILIGVLAAAITSYSKQVMEKEIISLHQSILSQSVRPTVSIMDGLEETMEEIAENADVIEWISGNETHAEKASSYIKSEIFGNYQKGNKFRIYLCDEEEMVYGSDGIPSEEDVIWEYIKTQENLWNDEKDNVIEITGPVFIQSEMDVYRYSFYLTVPIRDLLNLEIRGYVVMQLGENGLYDGYRDLITSRREYCIVNKDGIVVSSRTKRKIGSLFSENNAVISGLESQQSGYIISEEIPDRVYFYENITGTEWYLLETADLREMFESVDKTGVFTIGLIVVFILCFLPLTFNSLHTILYPIDAIQNKMKCVAEGNRGARITEDEKGKGELSEIADSFNYMVDKLEEQIEEIKEINRKRHLLQLDFLQTQINPHFIYNTLSSIRFYVEMGKNKEAENMLLDFSKILRKTLSTSEKFITLREELETIQNYIDLQKARYRERFEVHFQIEEDTKECIVPDFIMQPIVENAIFYSLKEKQKCHIWVRSYRTEEELRISIRDDGIGMNETKINQVLNKGMNMNKVGIRNVHERLQLHYGKDYGLQIESEEGIGTEVILVMPVKYEGESINENINC